MPAPLFPYKLFNALVTAGLGIVFLNAAIIPEGRAEKAPSAAIEPPSLGGPPSMRLISDAQYANAIADIFGSDIKDASRFPPVRRVDGLVQLGASTAVMTPGALETFDSVGRAVATQVVDEAHRATLIPCKPSNIHESDDACARKFLGKAGRLLFRRPLEPESLEAYVGVATASTRSSKDFYSGLASALAGMLVSPQFIFLVERTEPDPDHPGGERLDGVSRAQRLSLLLWNSPPDDMLLSAAEAGDLYTTKGLERQVDRLLASPRIESGVRSFFEDMMDLEAFAELAKDPVIYPAFTLKVALEAKEQTLRIIVDHLLVRNGDYRDLFTTRRTFLTQDLGSIYRVPVHVSGPLDWTAYDLSDSDGRAGILTQAGFLAVYSQTGRSSPTRRGKGIREVFMCQTVPNPPPNVDFSLVNDPNQKFANARQRLTAHRSNPVCAGCHKITDPMGLALENFDGASQYRKTEGGVPIDASGELDKVSFSNAIELGVALHNNPAVTSCLVRRLYAYGIGRSLQKDSNELLTYYDQQFASEGFKLVPLLKTIATSSGFYRVRLSASSTSPPVSASIAAGN
jgi:hypothetical protein